MPVSGFASVPDQTKCFGCIYIILQSNESLVSPDRPIVILDNHRRKWRHHSCGVFANPNKRTIFEFKEEDGTYSANILQIDTRFVSLLQWLGENHINVRLSGENRDEGYVVCKIRKAASGGGIKPPAEDGFLQSIIGRLLANSAPADEHKEDDLDETGDDMRLTSLQSTTDFMACVGRITLDGIRLRARRNLTVVRSHEVSPEERRHAQRAFSITINIQWGDNYFEAIDPQRARRIPDEELYGMERAKQRIIETIIQINRTHAPPACDLLLVGLTGTGKPRIAYAVARILKFPWTALDMSSTNGPEQLTGSSRIYVSARLGIVIEAFSMTGEPSLVFTVNELNKAAAGKGNDNPTDVLLTPLDNLGFTGNYIECMIPAMGVRPIATANGKVQTSTPLVSRLTIIGTPDYTREEEKIIFSQYALPRVLKRMSMNANEYIVTEGTLCAVIEKCSNTTGIRDPEQAAEHITTNVFYQVEVDHTSQVVFSVEMVGKLFE